MGIKYASESGDLEGKLTKRLLAYFSTSVFDLNFLPEGGK
jgi:hypothetical protein